MALVSFYASPWGEVRRGVLAGAGSIGHFAAESPLPDPPQGEGGKFSRFAWACRAFIGRAGFFFLPPPWGRLGGGLFWRFRTAGHFAAESPLPNPPQGEGEEGCLLAQPGSVLVCLIKTPSPTLPKGRAKDFCGLDCSGRVGVLKGFGAFCLPPPWGRLGGGFLPAPDRSVISRQQTPTPTLPQGRAKKGVGPDLSYLPLGGGQEGGYSLGQGVGRARPRVTAGRLS